MAGRPHEHEGASLELDHLHTESRHRPVTRRRASRTRRRRTPCRDVAPRRVDVRRRVGLIGAALAVLLGGRRDALRRERFADHVVRPARQHRARRSAARRRSARRPGMQLNANLVDIAATPSGRGYWAAAADGGVFTFGDAPLRGLDRRPPARRRRSSASPRRRPGNGYWLVGADGGVFAFGDAGFHGSLGNPAADDLADRRDRGDAVAATATGWSAPTVACSPSATPPSRARRPSFAHGAPIVGIAPTPSGYGYYLLGADGGVFAFGDAHFAGSAIDGTHLATAIAVPSDGQGYEVARTDGSVVGLGGAPSVAAPADLLVGPAPGRRARAARHGGGAWLATTLRRRRRRSQSQSTCRRTRSSAARVRTSPTAPAATAPSAPTACTAARTSSCVDVEQRRPRRGPPRPRRCRPGRGVAGRPGPARAVPVPPRGRRARGADAARGLQ